MIPSLVRQAAAAAAAGLLRPFSTALCSESSAKRYRAGIFGLRSTFGQPFCEADVQDISSARIVFFGEIHEMPPCIELQARTAAAMLGSQPDSTKSPSASRTSSQSSPASPDSLSSSSDCTYPLPEAPIMQQYSSSESSQSKFAQQLPEEELPTAAQPVSLQPTATTLHIVMEHFSFEMQPLLDEYQTGNLSLQGLEEGSKSEGFHVSVYEPVLEFARSQPNRVKLHAGFIPRAYARIVMKESLEIALERAKANDWVSADETCAATEEHYNYFESMLTGRSQHDKSTAPTDKWRRIFPAQVIKDAAMAHKVNRLISASGPCDKFLVICGVGHSGYSHGVPERVFAHNAELEKQCFRIWCMHCDPAVDFSSQESVDNVLKEAFGPPGSSSPAELCLAFVEESVPLESLSKASRGV